MAFRTKAADLLQQIRDTVEEVQGKMGGVFASISTTSENANALIQSVRGDMENIIFASKKVAEDIQVITAGIRAGRGAVGRLLNDEKVADSASNAFSDFEKAAGNTREIFSTVLSHPFRISGSENPAGNGTNYDKCSATDRTGQR